VGDQRYYVSDTHKFQALTGWQPKVSVPQGLRLLSHWLAEFRGRQTMPTDTQSGESSLDRLQAESAQ
jgi:hypothetical protein